MKYSASFIALLAAQSAIAKIHSHERLHAIERRHHHQQHIHANRNAAPSPAEGAIEKKAVRCQFPTDKGLVAVPGDDLGNLNGGWAMRGDTPCEGGRYCQYSCPSGSLMTAWNTAVKTYPSPDGGVFCKSDGTIDWPAGPLCAVGATNVAAVDNTGKGVSFCQTVTPGDEGQHIATWIDSNSKQMLAIPKPNFFASIAAHYYINQPGIPTSKACCWGSPKAGPYGNWAALIGGGHQDADGTTWLNLGVNPKYKDDFANTPINFKVEIVCTGTCNNPCSYDPSQHGTFEMVGQEGTAWTMSLGVPSCVTTVTSGSAYFKVSMLEGSTSSPNSGSKSGGSNAASSSAAPSQASVVSSSASSASASAPSKAISVASVNSTDNDDSASSTTTADPTTWSPHVLIQQNRTSIGAMGTASSGMVLPTLSALSSGSTTAAAGQSSSTSSTGAGVRSVASLASLAISVLAALLLS